MSREEINLGFGTIYFGSKQKALCMAYRSVADVASNYCKIIFDTKSRFKEVDFRVIYYLIGYALELNFKSFILIKDFTKDTRKNLKTRIGHNLKKLYKKVQEKGLNLLDKKEIELVSRLSQYYEDSGFRYFEEHKENLCLPDPYDYLDIIKRLQIQLQKIIAKCK